LLSDNFFQAKFVRVVSTLWLPSNPSLLTPYTSLLKFRTSSSSRRKKIPRNCIRFQKILEKGDELGINKEVEIGTSGGCLPHVSPLGANRWRIGWQRQLSPWAPPPHPRILQQSCRTAVQFNDLWPWLRLNLSSSLLSSPKTIAA